MLILGSNIPGNPAHAWYGYLEILGLFFFSIVSDCALDDAPLIPFPIYACTREFPPPHHRVDGSPGDTVQSMFSFAFTNTQSTSRCVTVILLITVPESWYDTHVTEVLAQRIT